MEDLLIVEDDKNIRDTLKDLLELSGYRVSTANNGQEGFDAIISNPPDLVLCDVNMPKIDGFELLSVINQRLKDKVIPPFIFLTAKVEKQNIRYGMSLGADDYILKPFDNNELMKVIRLRLDKRKKLIKPKIKTFDKLALPCSDGLELVSFDNIVKCQADRAYCTFSLIDGRTLLISKPMKEFEKILTSRHFFKTHKSTIINIKCIKKYIRGKNGSLLLTDGSHVPVSAGNKELLMKILRPEG